MFLLVFTRAQHTRHRGCVSKVLGCGSASRVLCTRHSWVPPSSTRHERWLPITWYRGTGKKAMHNRMKTRASIQYITHWERTRVRAAAHGQGRRLRGLSCSSHQHEFTALAVCCTTDHFKLFQERAMCLLLWLCWWSQLLEDWQPAVVNLVVKNK